MTRREAKRAVSSAVAHIISMSAQGDDEYISATFNDRQLVAPDLACMGCKHLRYRPGGSPRCMRHGVFLHVRLDDVRRAEVCLRTGGREL